MIYSKDTQTSADEKTLKGSISSNFLSNFNLHANCGCNTNAFPLLVISMLLAYFFIRQIREMKMWYRVGM